MDDRYYRNAGDGGDRRQDASSLSQPTEHAPIQFLSPRESDRRISIPKKLADLANEGGKHRDNLLHELALLWARYVARGEFRVSMRMLEELYSSKFRKKFKKILDAMATPTKTHSNFTGNARSRLYKFNLPCPKKGPTYSGIPPGPGGDSDQPRPAVVTVVLSASWLWGRYERWSAICERNDWVSHLDLDGRTDWGRPLLESLDATTVPIAPETERLTIRGVVRSAHRIDGRCYHALTNLRKDLRRESLIDGEPTEELDIHACYTSLLISKLPNGDSKERAIAALRPNWYSQFDEAYSGWFDNRCAMGKAYINETGRWIIRQDDDPANDVPASIKIEYQRQCLFWRDGREESNPMRRSLRQLHPELCQLIENWRQRMTPSELSNVLTRAEGSLVVDSAMAELERAGIKAITNHDAVVVPDSKAEKAMELLLGVAEWHLGFRPNVSIKATKSISLKR